MEDALNATSAQLQPLLEAYTDSLAAAQASQQQLHARLNAVLQTLRDAQVSSDEAEVARMSGAAARVEVLRKQLEGVAELMARVQARLENLQRAVTAKELAKGVK
jgi:hypothetical protein